MAYGSNTSSAYDLTVFEAPPEPKRLKQENIRVINNPKQFLVSVVTAKNLCVFLMAITVVSLIIYNNVKLAEITSKISKLDSEMTTLSSEYVKLQSTQGSMMSPRKVAELAENELGLQRLDKYQTEYLYLYHEDRIEVAGEKTPEGIAVRAKLLFNSAVNKVKEYIVSN